MLGCASPAPYVPTGSMMGVTQARHAIESFLPGQYAYPAGDLYRPNRVSQVRLRGDGLGLLWFEGHVVFDGLTSSHRQFASQPTLKLCYFDLMHPEAFDYRGRFLVKGICDFELELGTEAQARTIADALYVLKANAKQQ